jgi:pimeloyl-ACP methyl ester carboxylesterase
MDLGASLEMLGRYFHVYAFDKPGQGLSDCPSSANEFVIGTTIQHTYNFMKVMGIEKAHLVGHSRGGYTVSRLAMEYPEVASSVIIIDSGTLMPTAPQNWYEERDRKAQQITDPEIL